MHGLYRKIQNLFFNVRPQKFTINVQKIYLSLIFFNMFNEQIILHEIWHIHLLVDELNKFYIEFTLTVIKIAVRI